jgi:hypothetical protein
MPPLTHGPTLQLGLADNLVALLTRVVDWLTADRRAAAARLVVPRVRSLNSRNIIPMPTNILADVTTLVPLEFDNLAGSVVPTPAGDTATVTNDNPAACAASVEASAGNAALTDGTLLLVLTPVQPAQIGAVCNIAVNNVLPDGRTFITPTVDFTIAADATATNAHLVTAGMMTRALPTP